MIVLLRGLSPSPASLTITANTATVGAGQSLSYTIDVRRADPRGRTTSIYFDAAPGTTIVSANSGTADGCIQPSGTHAQCVGVVSATQSQLMFVTVRASTTARCDDYLAHARADDHTDPPVDAWLTLPRSATDCTIALPIVQSAPKSIPYPER